MITAGDALSDDRLPVYLGLARTSAEHAVPRCCINSGSPPYGLALRRYPVLARCHPSAVACYQSIDGGASPPPSIVIQRQTSLVPFARAAPALCCELAGQPVPRNIDPDRLAMWVDAAILCGALTTAIGVVMAVLVIR
jgi:hypothetical protein